MQYIGKIGNGSQGTVHYAYHRVWKQHVAVKKFVYEHVAHQEASIYERMVDCHQIPKMYEYDPNEMQITMEYIPGILGKHIVEHAKQGIYLTEGELRYIIHDIATALQYMHERLILYGDMKPANIIYQPPAQAKLFDFGCSREGIEFYTLLGTPYYYSPEKFSFCYGYPSDVWALGIVLYMMVCGMHPFVHHYERVDDIYTLEHEIYATKLTFAHPRWDHMSYEVMQLIREMLQKDPDRRITIDEVLEHPWFMMRQRRGKNSLKGV